MHPPQGFDRNGSGAKARGLGTWGCARLRLGIEVVVGLRDRGRGFNSVESALPQMRYLAYVRFDHEATETHAIEPHL